MSYESAFSIGPQVSRMRLSLPAATVAADALTWRPEHPADAVLLDAPCSSTGVIRRHPDIKLLRRPGDIAAFVASQRSLLQQCLKLLKPGGRLLYCTCSLLPAENEQVVEATLGAVATARAVALEAPGLLPGEVLPRSLGVQLLPGTQADTDGFYYACLTVT